MQNKDENNLSSAARVQWIVPCKNSSMLNIDDLYLRHSLHECGSVEKPFVYSNFIVSLDGRISVPLLTDGGKNLRQVPRETSNANDLHLFKQLFTQSDAVIVSSSHLRAAARSKENGLLRLHGKRDEKLIQWRVKQGLTVRPAIVVISNSLDLPHRDLLPYSQQDLYVMTWSPEASKKQKELQQKGYTLLKTSNGIVNIAEFIRTLGEHGFSTIYSATGPFLFTELLRNEALDRLYLTITLQMLGGETFDTLTTGSFFESPCNFALSELYWDTTLPKNAGQFFAVFDSLGHS